jgi:hypothetical protein
MNVSEKEATSNSKGDLKIEAACTPDTTATLSTSTQSKDQRVEPNENLMSV